MKMAAKFFRVACYFEGKVRSLGICAMLVATVAAEAQGVITFDAHPVFDGRNYVEAGLRFQVVVPPGASQ